MQRLHKIITLLCILMLLTSCAPAADINKPLELTVAAAADLQFAFTEISNEFEQETGHEVTLVFGSTGQLTQQIANGAPYDLFAAADVAAITDLADQNLVLPDSVSRFARGNIVLAVNRASGVKAVTLQDLLSDQIEHVAIANPTHAPYGAAAKQALQSAGVWEQIQAKVVFSENIRQTLQYIQTGDAEVGIVARSLVDVPEISWTPIDEALYDPLDQALAVITGSPYHEVARQFAAFVLSPRGIAILQNYGFALPGEPLTTPGQ